MYAFDKNRGKSNIVMSYIDIIDVPSLDELYNVKGINILIEDLESKGFNLEDFNDAFQTPFRLPQDKQ